MALVLLSLIGFEVTLVHTVVSCLEAFCKKRDINILTNKNKPNWPGLSVHLLLKLSPVTPFQK